MKILYALQATGNGHISRANEIIPILEKFCRVDILVSGTQSDVPLNHLIKFRRKGLSFVAGKKGGIDYLKTLQCMNTRQFVREVKSIPVEAYDLVINDFEPLSAWACKQKNVHCIALSHQYAVLMSGAPKPKKFNPMAWLIMRYYAPCSDGIGFHFSVYDKKTYTPVIRSEIRNAYNRNHGHYCVYLPAYKDSNLIKILSQFKNISWHIFTRQSSKNYSEKNCWIRPVNNYDFISSFTSCAGIICAAGFETPAEALYLNKKLMVIPMKGQYEQQCNAAALKQMGVMVVKKFNASKYQKIQAWLLDKTTIHIPYKDNSMQIIRFILADYINCIQDEIPMQLTESQSNFLVPETPGV